MFIKSHRDRNEECVREVSDAEAHEVSVKEFEEVCLAIKTKREEIDAIKAKKAVADEELEVLEKRAQAMLEISEKDKYVSEHGTVYLSYYASVSAPKELDKKHAFFDYLKGAGIFDEVVTVNSQWLNGYYRKEKEAAEKEGNILFSLPGIDEPRVSPRLGFRKG